MFSRNELAETIHKARWPTDRQMAITPFADEDRNGREYCFRIADAVLGSTFAQGRPSKFSPGDPVEVRNQNDEIDEIIIRRGDVHIEQMSSDGWFMGVDGADGSYWQFWFGSKNRKSHVQFRHTETVSEQESSSTPVQAIEPTHVSWLDADYNKARDCMIGLLRGHGWTISDNSVGVKEFDNAFQHAVGILALTASTDSISVNLPFERLPQHAGDPGFGPVPNIIHLGSSDPNHPSNIAAVTSSTPWRQESSDDEKIDYAEDILSAVTSTDGGKP